MNQKEYRIYVVGTSFGYASWIQGNLTKKMKEADVVLFTGGEDISPSLYKESIGKNTYFGRPNSDGLSYRDQYEVEAFKEARNLDIPMFGTCRGAQLLCCLAGGKLIQDMEHWQSHKLYFYDNEYTSGSNTLHHQMQYPYNMVKDEDYKILAHAIGQSPYFLDGNNKPIVMPERDSNNKVKEPEFVYYPKIKALGIQGHPKILGCINRMNCWKTSIIGQSAA